MFDSFAVERNTYQCRIKALRRQVKALEDGSAMQELRREYEKIYAKMEKKLLRIEIHSGFNFRMAKPLCHKMQWHTIVV